MGKPTICIGENKDADQLRGNREADQRLCFRFSDSTIPLLLKSEISVGFPTRRLIYHFHINLEFRTISIYCFRSVSGFCTNDRKPGDTFYHDMDQSKTLFMPLVLN